MLKTRFKGHVGPRAVFELFLLCITKKRIYRKIISNCSQQQKTIEKFPTLSLQKII